MEISEVISRFKSLDLTTYPQQKIMDLFMQVGPIGYVVVTYHKGKAVMRARPNYNGERFELKKDYSFKPSEFNKTYQRASTPNQTMFYATSLPDNIPEGELDNMRAIGVMETVAMLRDKMQSGYQKISFGKWHVLQDINLVAIVHKDSFYEKSSYTKELVNGYKKFIEEASPIVKERSLQFQSFLADEFAKADIRGDYDYMISAIFTELTTNRGFDGVLYPSVRVDGMGFNIAITPEACNKLGLYVAGECSIYKLKDHTIVGNDAIVELDGMEEKFTLVDMNNNQAAHLAELGVASIDELK